MGVRRIDVGEVFLLVADDGEGRPVLLLHGFPDSHLLWRRQIPALVEAGFRAIAPDLRGFGESDRPERRNSYEMPMIVDDLRNLLDALSVEAAHVVGHDWGAIAAWAFAGWEPKRVLSLTAISVGHPRSFLAPSLSQIARSWYAIFFGLPWLPEKALSARRWELLRRLFGASPDFDRYLQDLSRPGALTAALNWYRANTLRSFLQYPSVQAPTLGVWGSKDWALGERQMTRSRQYVRATFRYEKLEAGHWIPLRRAEVLNPLLIEFVSET